MVSHYLERLRDVSVAQVSRGPDCETRRHHRQPNPPAGRECQRASDLERVADNETPAIERTAMLRPMFRQERRKAIRHACIVETHSARYRCAISAVLLAVAPARCFSDGRARGSG